MNTTDNFMEVNRAFKILKLDENASLLDIEKAYRRLVKRYHPDKCAGEEKLKCKEKFIEVKNARECLKSFYAYGREVSAVKEYREYIEYIKRFYDDLFGGLDLW